MTAHSASNKADLHSKQIPLGFGELHAHLGDHIGHFYESRVQGRQTLVDFIAAGLAARHKCVFITPEPREDFMAAMAARSIAADAAIESGQLLVMPGYLSPREMHELLESCLDDIPDRYQVLRWAGEMTWSLEKMPTTEKLMEWESCCNVVEDMPVVFLCQYDLKVFRGDVVLDALKTHPLCIVGNVIHRNPFYENPADYLADLRRRRACN